MARLAPSIIWVEMPPVRPDKRTRPGLGVLQALFLAATAGELAVFGPAQAQENAELRGAFGAVNPDAALLVDQNVAQADPPPAYVPVSPGALPDEPATDSPNAFDDACAKATISGLPL